MVKESHFLKKFDMSLILIEHLTYIIETGQILSQML